MNSFKIGSQLINNENIFFIAEEGQANLGDFEKALKMIEIATNVGANAIEFQLARAGDLYVRSHEGYKTYQKREFSLEQIEDLISSVKAKNIEIIITPLSHQLIEPLVNAGCCAFNINATDLNNPDIVDSIIDTDLPFFLSLPLATQKEIDWTINRIIKKHDDKFMLLHGQHTMATCNKGVDVESTSLGFIRSLKEKYNVPVGFIDHTPFDWMPACAVSAGADIVTKHLTWSHSYKGPDWQICLEPTEMKNAITWARMMNLSIKQKEKKPSEEEILDRSILRRSIVASRYIKSGHIIQKDDICFKRPGDGLDPVVYNSVIGKIAKNNIAPDQKITKLDLEGD